MKNHERFGKRIVGANKVVDFLRKFFRQKGATVKRTCGRTSRHGLRTASARCTWSISARTRSTGPARSWTV
ncbi:unnamed protein product [Pylaiella littoralis]